MSAAHRPRSSSTNGSHSPVTDEELMLWVDGELDPGRAADVQAWVARDARARALVAALRQAAEVLADDALDRARVAGADSIADSVMAAIDAEPARAVVAPVVPLPKRRAPVAALGLLVAAAAAVLVMNWPSHRGGPVGPEAFSGAVIDVVDFGARPGTIFYVPSEDQNSTAAVVWLTEDDTGPDDPSPSSGETL